MTTSTEELEVFRFSRTTYRRVLGLAAILPFSIVAACTGMVVFALMLGSVGIAAMALWLGTAGAFFGWKDLRKRMLNRYADKVTLAIGEGGLFFSDGLRLSWSDVIFSNPHVSSELVSVITTDRTELLISRAATDGSNRFDEGRQMLLRKLEQHNPESLVDD